MSGTLPDPDVGYGATARSPVLAYDMMLSADVGYAATRLRGRASQGRRSSARWPPICLRAFYELPGTITPYGTICRCACYAVPGSDIPYGTTSSYMHYAGGINGPNKLEGLVAVGVLRAGQLPYLPTHLLCHVRN
eukprot:3223904-Rhodomonas_salina.6